MQREGVERADAVAQRPNGLFVVGGGDFLQFEPQPLRFRAQAPIVDQLLREIGLEAGDIQRLAGGAGGAATSPPSSFDDHAIGLGDLDLGLKLRVWKADLGPVDTIRLAVLGGVEIPTGTEGFGSSSVDPYLGAALTSIFGRHGFGAAVRWTFTTGSAFDPLFAGDTTADLLRLDASYVFRVSPEEYGELHEAAWYAVAEANSYYETNGDWQVLFSPALLIEAPRWALEAGVQIPVYQDVSGRPELRLGFVLGLRLLF